jgi:hypothetical protein
VASVKPFAPTKGGVESMAYYLDLFSPETYEAFGRSSRTISGFRMRQLNAAKGIHPEDRFLCYMTKLSRWFGVLEVASECFINDEPIFVPENDPFTVRFKVNVVAWLPKEKALPIHEDEVWNALSFTRGHSHNTSTWTGKVRASLVRIDDVDGEFLERLIIEQATGGREYPVAEEKYQRLITQTIRREDKIVVVTVPEDRELVSEVSDKEQTTRESHRMQGLLASVGEKMGFKIWLPKADRSAVLRDWRPEEGMLLDILPLNYDETTLKTIEQIDVLWLKRRSIVRAFEVEHTTAVYSGILRMADLLALQPNMDIKLHIVAPEYRRDKVFEEIQRPVFSLLEKGPLIEYCTFIPYDSLIELSELKYLAHVSDSILEDYAEPAEYGY